MIDLTPEQIQYLLDNMMASNGQMYITLDVESDQTGLIDTLLKYHQSLISCDSISIINLKFNLSSVIGIFLSSMDSNAQWGHYTFTFAHDWCDDMDKVYEDFKHIKVELEHELLEFNIGRPPLIMFNQVILKGEERTVSTIGRVHLNFIMK